jgi:hypothetical protein
MIFLRSGFCQTVRACTSSASCPTTNITEDWNQESFNCPLLEKISPTRGLTDQNTLITVFSSFILNGQVIDPSDALCDFGAYGTTVVEALSFNSLSCRTPRINVTTTVSVRVRYKGGFWTTNSLPFTFYGKS